MPHLFIKLFELMLNFFSSLRRPSVLKNFIRTSVFYLVFCVRPYDNKLLFLSGAAFAQREAIFVNSVFPRVFFPVDIRRTKVLSHQIY